MHRNVYVPDSSELRPSRLSLRRLKCARFSAFAFNESARRHPDPKNRQHTLELSRTMVRYVKALAPVTRIFLGCLYRAQITQLRWYTAQKRGLRDEVSIPRVCDK